MKTTDTHDQRIAKITITKVYPMYVTKVERKGRTKEDLDTAIEWLTGFSPKEVQKLIDSETTFADFFRKATLNKNAKLITGTICGYRIEEIQNKTTRQVRYLDKLVDELAKGRSMDKILRK